MLAAGEVVLPADRGMRIPVESDHRSGVRDHRYGRPRPAPSGAWAGGGCRDVKPVESDGKPLPATRPAFRRSHRLDGDDGVVGSDWNGWSDSSECALQGAPVDQVGRDAGCTAGVAAEIAS